MIGGNGPHFVEPPAIACTRSLDDICILASASVELHVFLLEAIAPFNRRADSHALIASGDDLHSPAQGALVSVLLRTATPLIRVSRPALQFLVLTHAHVDGRLTYRVHLFPKRLINCSHIALFLCGGYLSKRHVLIL